MKTSNNENLPAHLRVEVDTSHSYFGPHKPTMEAARVAELGLVPGQKVIAYMPPDPEDVWPGVIGYDADLEPKWQWWVELNG